MHEVNGMTKLGVGIGSRLTNRPDRALSIRQPWAWLILHAGKDIENRNWCTHYRGRVLIHAAKGCTRQEYIDAAEFARSAIAEDLRGITLPPLRELQRGGIVGCIDVTDCVTQSDSKWFVGKYGFVLRNPEPTSFIPYRGQLGFFNLVA